ncbi:MAG TPA: NRDE family protein [Arenicellales bacterium]|nr:NRDE family protein [Arenicellales bacterium]
MCLLFCCQRADEEYPFILLANRDERYQRPARAAEFWPEDAALLAGRDLQRGGTWLGITRAGRWAALTNFREPSRGEYERSRGEIVRDYLTGGRSARRFASELKDVASLFDGFNLLFGDRHESLWFSNRGGSLHSMGSGIYGLSNHLLETPWPKVASGKRSLHRILSGELVTDRLFEPLADRTVYDEGLPETGVDPEVERMLSSAFITSSWYGTRTSTLIMINRSGHVYFEERTYDKRTAGRPRPDEYSSKIFNFRLD